MSSILKALRKLEEEKRGGKLAAPDLRVDQGQSTRKRGLLLPTVTGGVLGAVIMGLLFFWVVDQKDPVPTGPADAVVKKTPPEVLRTDTATAVPKQPKGPSTQPGAAFSERAEDVVTSTVAHPTPVPAPQIKSVPIPAAKSPPASKDEQPSQSTVKKGEYRAVRQAASLPESSQKLPAGVVLAVTEVFYQEDAANSMAVVNDLPVMVGTFVDAAVVSDIRPDHVIFTIDGEKYSVPLAGSH